jgi:hypothetical protein
MPAIALDGPAVLIWLPDGMKPTDKDFDVNQSWLLEDAVEQACRASRDHSKRPWIKSDGRIWGEQEIALAMYGLRALKHAR